MEILKNIEVPTGNILIVSGERGKLECLSIGDYGKKANIKADFLGLTEEINGVEHNLMLPLEEKWVVTISSQYGCSMGCAFCDVPKVGYGRNATVLDLVEQVRSAISIHPEVESTDRLNLHFARMGEPTWNFNVIPATRSIKDWMDKKSFRFHPVVSTMLPAKNKKLWNFISEWLQLKNELMNGEAGLQLSIQSTSEKERDEMFNGNTHSLTTISTEMNKILQHRGLRGRKIALNFAIDDASIISGEFLRTIFDPEFYMCKITPIHACAAAVDNGYSTTEGYDSYYPYKEIEQDMKDAGFDTLVFVPSKEEDESRITCGNAILANNDD